MQIGGFQRFSLIDYPGKICAVVFTQGCNFRCGYCHNPELVPRTEGKISEEAVLSFLERRRPLLDAVTITGGEPLLQEDIADFIRKVKEKGFSVKLDTNGSFPERLSSLLDELDYVAMDVKAPLYKYKSVAGVHINEGKIKKSIEIIMNSGVDYEFRTTVVRSELSKEDIIEIGRMLNGAKRFVLQKVRTEKVLNERFRTAKTYSDAEFEDMRRELERYVEECIVR